MKDYTLSELHKLCKGTPCKDCPLYRRNDDCCFLVHFPDVWNMEEIEPNVVNEREAIIQGFVKLLKESIFAADPNKKQAIDGFLDDRAIFFLENTIDMTAEQIKLLIETNELIDYIRKDNKNEN